MITLGRPRMGAVSAGGELDPVTQQHVAHFVDALCEEFGEAHSRETIEGLMGDSVQGLAGEAQVGEFVPVLAHRFTRERLKALVRAGAAETGDVLFIGLGDTGRGQMAAALLVLRSEGRVTAHSAGSTIGSGIEPAVVEVMSELGVDLSEAYAKPLSAEVLEGAAVIVTMVAASARSRSRRANAMRIGGSATLPKPPWTRCGAYGTTSIAACGRCSPTSTPRREARSPPRTTRTQSSSSCRSPGRSCVRACRRRRTSAATGTARTSGCRGPRARRP